jgi:hypothetical protein
MFTAVLGNTELRVQQAVPADGTVQNFRVLIEVAPGAGKTWTFTVRNNGTDTAVSCSITGASQTTCFDPTDTAIFTAGQLISVSITGTNGNAGSPGRWTAVYGP